MAEVLVTGGAGFIGSHVVDHLVGAGRRVVVLDDFSGGFAENVHPEAECVEGSIVDHTLVDGLFVRHRFEYVFHLAAYASHERVKEAFGDLIEEVPLEQGIGRMAKWARRHGARQSKKFDHIEVRRNLPPSWAEGD